MRGSRVYRPEIDGLRAIAVAAVIANHFSSNLLPGGYLGVDVFFVISGYVIGASLAGEVDRSPRTFLTHFYVRRVKRLLPALVVCVLLTALVGSAFIDPATADYTRIMTTGAWSLFGASNIFCSPRPPTISHFQPSSIRSSTPGRWASRSNSISSFRRCFCG